MKTTTGLHLSQLQSLLLAAAAVILPRSIRSDWTRTWHAELWHLHHPRSGAPLNHSKPNLTSGLICDALWLRTDACKRALRGSAAACLLVLTAACLLAILAGWGAAGSLENFRARIAVFLLEAPLVVGVTFATTSRRHIHDGASLSFIIRLRGRLFLLAKSGLALTLSFLVTMDLTLPAHAILPLASDLLQMLLWVILAIAGVRWAILDQEKRCKHCLLLLTSPARVGRPSHNLLEWNGTEQICSKGHGLLSSPELETSWCSHSRWLTRAQEPQLLA